MVKKQRCVPEFTNNLCTSENIPNLAYFRKFTTIEGIYYVWYMFGFGRELLLYFCFSLLISLLTSLLRFAKNEKSTTDPKNRKRY